MIATVTAPSKNTTTKSSDNRTSSHNEKTKGRSIAYRLFKLKDTLGRKKRQHLLLAKRKLDLTLCLVYSNPSAYDELKEKKFELLYSQAFLYDVTEFGINLKKTTNLNDAGLIKYTDIYMSRWQPTRYLIKSKTSPDIPKRVIIGRGVTVREKTLNLKRRDRRYKF